MILCFLFLNVCLSPVHIQHEGQVPGQRPARPQQQHLSKLEEHCLLSLQSKTPTHPHVVPTAQTGFTPGHADLWCVLSNPADKERPCIM